MQFLLVPFLFDLQWNLIYFPECGSALRKSVQNLPHFLYKTLHYTADSPRAHTFPTYLEGCCRVSHSKQRGASVTQPPEHHLMVSVATQERSAARPGFVFLGNFLFLGRGNPELASFHGGQKAPKFSRFQPQKTVALHKQRAGM